MSDEKETDLKEEWEAREKNPLKGMMEAAKEFMLGFENRPTTVKVTIDNVNPRKLAKLAMMLDQLDYLCPDFPMDKAEIEKLEKKEKKAHKHEGQD